ncbi:alpha/beta hydrolase [Sphingomonas sp. RP10(2022)]|uniref:Alpha/beta hydrolase n=1 Tax=Sphingomonas liriopis TaxID=2949094 RepID=A0A9X2HRM4_9SPHN|nr:alpha/beta hydrolase fold domain-containing protein [Sphingomonas liriopis]MCP3735923.1 alpha/beta hydrolase [Sphingomonas liriopis]
MRLAALALLACAPPPAIAQTAPSSLPAPAELARAIPLGTGELPAGNGPEQWTGKPGAMSVRNTVSASLLPVLPEAGKANGAAVVIAPGGAFMTLSWDHEGMEIARAMAAHGIAAFVLKYRLDPTPRDGAGYGRAMSARMSGWIGKPGEGLKIVTPPTAIADGVAALRLIRARAPGWGIDPARVGMIGFSAGARLTLAVATMAAPADRPAFIAPIYPPMERLSVPADAPPMFVAMATDDPLSGRAGYGLVESWVVARRPVEFHAYQRSGHGFGAGVKGTTTEGWLDGLLRWIAFNGFLKAKS